MNPVFIIKNFLNGVLKEKSPSAVGLGVAFGFMLGIIPKNNLTAQVIFILAFVFKTNIPFFFISVVIFSQFYFLTDKITDPLGYAILSSERFYSIFKWMYNAFLIPWTDFNNTVVMGGVVLGMVMFYPVYLISKKFAEKYLINIAQKIAGMKIVKILKLSWLFEWYFRD